MSIASFLTSGPGSILKAGLGGVAGALDSGPTVTNTSQDTNSTGESNTNFNQFSNQNFATWLSNLINSSSNQSGKSSTNYNLDPSTRALLDKLTGSYSSLAQPFNTQAYQSGQIQGINRNSDLQSQAVNQIMAARGVQGPAAATAQTGVENQRFGNINQVYQQTPFVAQQFGLNNLNAAAAFASSIPKGTTTSTVGSTDSTQSSNQQGNQTSSTAAGGTGYTSTAQTGHSTGTSSTQKKGGAASGIAGVLAGLFG